MKSINPATGEEIATHEELTQAQIDAALDRATATFATWRNTVAIESSKVAANRAKRSPGSSNIDSNRLLVTVSPNTDAVSASVNGVD